MGLNQSNGYMVYPCAAGNTRGTAGGCLTRNKAFHLRRLTDLFELLCRQIILINYRNGLFTVQNLVACIQKMKMPVANLHMRIIPDLKFVKTSREFQITDPKTRIFYRFSYLINVNVGVFFKYNIERGIFYIWFNRLYKRFCLQGFIDRIAAHSTG